LVVQNDNWPAGGADDNRTASLDAGFHLGGEWRLGVAFDMFTQKDRNYDWDTFTTTHNYVTTTTTVTTGHGPNSHAGDHPNYHAWQHVHTTTTTSTVDNATTTIDSGSTNLIDREDALSLTLNRRLWDMITLGAGVRITGDLKGEEVQNFWHRTIGDPTIYKLQYPETEFTPLFVADLRNYSVNPNGANLYWSASLASCNRSVEQEYGVGIWGGNSQESICWLGLNLNEFAGHTQDYVIDQSWKNEEGFGLEAGMTMQALLLRVVWRQEGHVQGEIGFTF
jgi:hypothetical protein